MWFPQGSNVVEDQDLLEIGILNSAHRQRLLQAIRLLPRVRVIRYTHTYTGIKCEVLVLRQFIWTELGLGFV